MRVKDWQVVVYGAALVALGWMVGFAAGYMWNLH